jgi:hypothetical protein
VTHALDVDDRPARARARGLRVRADIRFERGHLAGRGGLGPILGSTSVRAAGVGGGARGFAAWTRRL